MKVFIKNLALFLFCIFSSAAFAQDTTNNIKPARDTVYVYQSKRPRYIRPAFHYPGKQFFFEGDFTGCVLEGGAEIIGGYRFGQFGILGLGIGADIVALGYPSGIFSNDPYGGGFFPIFLHYSGDILKKRITPYYSIDAGYAIRTDKNDTLYITVTPLNHPVYKFLGGFAGTADFGVKLYGRGRVYATWSIELDVKQAMDKYSNYYYNTIGENIKVSYSSSTFLLMPGFKIGVGF